MKKNYFLTQLQLVYHRIKSGSHYQMFIACLVLFCFSFSGYAQKSKDIEPVLYCVKELGNGLYQASFGYVNPTKKEVVIDENGSIIKSNNGKRVAKGLNKFKPGPNDKVFTKEFGSGDYVQWTINSNGNSHTVIANANSAKKCEPDDGFIFPVIGNGKSSEIIGQEFTALCENLGGRNYSDFIFQLDDGGRILTEIVPKPTRMNQVLLLLQSNVFEVEPEDFLLDVNEIETLGSIDVYLTLEKICLINEYKEIINFARPVYPAKISSGGVVSQGDASQRSFDVKESFRFVDPDGKIIPVDGTGIKIGVLSDSYDKELGIPANAEIDVEEKELPEGVDLLLDNPFKATDEGRAMMQIIHDVAPGAGLAFHTGTSSPRQFELGFVALKEANCDIIVDDITFITEPFFGLGRISEVVQEFVAEPGKFHFTSAGNIANKGYQAVFKSSSNVPTTNFISSIDTRAHVFGLNQDGSEDYLQKISVVPGTYLIALQWKEDIASQGDPDGALNDLDIFIVDDQGRLLVGNNRINVKGDPTEIIVFRSTGTGEANIMITRAEGTANVPFRYIAFRTVADDETNPNGLQIVEYFENQSVVGATTISGHAMTPESITVGAVDYRNMDNPVAESFSSYSGTLADGTKLQVDMYAPDGGNTTTSIGQFANCETCDKDEFRNFYGTSASAPHAAGAMALLRSAVPSWFPDGSFSSENSTAIFQSTGKTFITRDGSEGKFINTLEAFKSIASQTSRITDLIVEEGKTASLEPFTVTIIGDFFPENEEKVTVLFDEQPLENVEIYKTPEGKTEIKATVPTFSGNPELVIVTEGQTPGGTDGGPSDPAYFFKDGKIALNIIPNNVEFEYGQDISLSYTVEGLPEEIDLSKTFPVILAELGLPEVILSSAAESIPDGTYPFARKYRIQPSFAEGATYDQELFQINFIDGYLTEEFDEVGYLTITKKDLIISTEDVSIVYGDIVDIPLIYEFEDDGIAEVSLFYASIANSHASDFKEGIPNKFQALVSKFQALVSEYDLAFLDGGSWSASERTIQNKFQALVSGTGVIALENENFSDYISARDAYDSGETNKFQALVSKFQALVSTEDLLAGDVDLGEINKFQALVSKFQALVSTEDPEREYAAYEKVFTIVDAEDAPPEDGSDDERTISQIYALNMITGLDVTSESENHRVYPGAFLNPMIANFNIIYKPGQLKVSPKDLMISTNNIEIEYGETPTKELLLSNTVFDGWAFEGDAKESVDTYFLAEEMPFVFVKDGVTYEVDELKEVGTYLIKFKTIKNYTNQDIHDDTYGTLKIGKKVLLASIEDVIINEGEVPEFYSVITGFADGESVSTVFPNGNVPYYLLDENGNEGNFNETGVYAIKIEEPDNYIIEYNPEAKLFINPYDARKIRTFADCVVYRERPDGLNYKVTFRYENDNDNTVYVIEETKNYLSGNDNFQGQLPTSFLPGSGTFEIYFDGNPITWNLETYGSVNKSSVSSANNDGTGECDAKLENYYLVYPNPVSDELTVEKNIVERSNLYVLDLFGQVVLEYSLNEGTGKYKIYMSSCECESGLYIIRIVGVSEVSTFNIIKE